jgi:hypothetical protein
MRFRRARPRSGTAPPSGLVGGHTEALSRIEPIGGDAHGRVAAAPPPARLRTRWYFAAAVVFGVLAVFVLPTPFSGFASLASVCAFVTGGVRRINSGDPEMVKRTTRSGIIGGGGV